MKRAAASMIRAALIVGSWALGADSAARPSPTTAPGLEPSFSVDARVMLNAFAALAEEHLGGVSRGARLIAAGEAAVGADWERLKPVLSLLAKNSPTAASVWYARADGTYFTAEQGPTGQSLADRPYFSELLAGKSVVGSLVISRSTGERSVIVAEPIRKNGHIAGAIGVSLSVVKMSRMIDEKLRLPPDMVFYALDAEGRTALHRSPTLMFEYPSDLGGETLRAAVAQMLSRPEGTVRYEFRGIQKTVVFEKGPLTGWVFALGAPSVREPQ